MGLGDCCRFVVGGRNEMDRKSNPPSKKGCVLEAEGMWRFP